MPKLLLILLVCWFAAMTLTPLVRRVATTLGVYDEPDSRKVHSHPIPYLGGVAVFLALVPGLIALWLLARDPAGHLQRADPRLLAILGGATFLFLVGLVDDVRRLRARVKLSLQIVAATCVWWSGVRIDGIHVTEGLQIEFGALSLPITVLWIVGITNAVNLIDGLDGLAGSLSVIGAAAIAYLGWQAGEPAMVAAMVALIGALLGFLYYNFHPAKIFLGDCGSYFTGFLLASGSLFAAAKSTTLIGLAIPIAALGVPLFDTLFTMLRRFLDRRPIMSPDRGHIHHRLLDKGFAQPKIVLLLCLETALATLLGIVLLRAAPSTRIAALAAVVLLHLLVFRGAGAIRLRETWHKMRESRRQVSRSRRQLLHGSRFRVAKCAESVPDLIDQASEMNSTPSHSKRPAALFESSGD